MPSILTAHQGGLALSASLFVTVASIASAQMMPVRQRAHWDVVTQYARGDRAAALTSISEWTQKDLGLTLKFVEDLAKAARRCEGCDDRRRFDGLPLRAAVLLHAERDEADRKARVEENGGAAECSVRPHAQFAEELLESIVLQSEGMEFARRFSVAQSLRLRSAYCFLRARHWAEVGLKLVPRNAELHLVQGLASESIGSTGFAEPVWRTEYDARGRPRQVLGEIDRNEELNRAAQAFETALSLVPGFAEARLRLGRVQWRLRRGAPARESLRLAVSESEGPLRYLAHLFYGQCLEDDGNVAGAIEEYAAALRLRPESQVSGMALAHAYSLGGESERAREILEIVLPLAGKRRTLDPFLSYLVGPETEGDILLRTLREEAVK